MCERCELMNPVMQFIDKKITKLYEINAEELTINDKNINKKVIKIMNSTYKYYGDSRVIGIMNNFKIYIQKYLNKKEFKDNNYLNHILLYCYEKAICSYIGDKAYVTIFELLQKLKKWSLKTYEGKKMSFGFIINCNQYNNQNNDNKQDNNKKYYDFLDSNFSAVLSDGQISVIELDYKGNFLQYHSYENNSDIDKELICPYKYNCITAKCNGNNVGIVLDDLGNIVLIKKNSINYAYMNGEWIYYDVDHFVQPIFNVLYSQLNSSVEKEKGNMLLKSIFNSTLDMVFKGEGCCIAIIEDDCLDTFRKKVYDSIDKPTNDMKVWMKKFFIRKTITLPSKTENIDKGINENNYNTFEK